MILTYTYGQRANTPTSSPAPTGPKAERPRMARRALEILKACAEEWDLAPSLLTGERRQSFITEARHAAMVLLREEGLTHEEVASIFRRDHTTVIHATKRHRERMESERYVARMQRVRERLGGGRSKDQCS